MLGETRTYSFSAITRAVRLIEGGARFIATNPDASGPSLEGKLPATGAVAAMITKITGREPYYVGKPNPMMFRSALNTIDAHSESTVMVGDRMDTDVVAGIEAGLETILVLTGSTARTDVERYPFRPHRSSTRSPTSSTWSEAAERARPRRAVGRGPLRPRVGPGLRRVRHPHRLLDAGRHGALHGRPGGAGLPRRRPRAAVGRHGPAATAGNAVGYWTGARYGRPWLEKRPPKVLKHLARAEQFYERFGPVALVVARFVPWARTFVPVLAGVSRMRYSQFLLATVAGALVWGAGLIVLGYYAATVPWLKTAAYVVAGTAVAMSVVVPLVAAVRRRLAARSGADGEPGAQSPSSDTE